MRYHNFTSASLEIYAIEKGLTLVGTMRLDRKGIPKEIKSLEHREEKSTMHAYVEEQNIMLVSYTEKKKSDKKNVVVLTTMH